MAGGTTPPKPNQQLAEHLDQLIPPPPFSLTGAGAAAIAANNTKNTSVPDADSSDLYLNLVFPPSQQPDNAILKPKPGYDVVALIFLLLTLPQSVSCLVLTSYILLGSFKSLAGKLIARYFLRVDDDLGVNLEAYSKRRYSYYRSELLGEFLQLFSINSFILLICHYSLPRAWFQYLIVLAKSIIASRLVGTHATGSTTYVSVVSNNTNHAGCVTTTTTTNSGQHAQLNGTSKAEARYFPSGLANFITGFSFVVAANYIKDRMTNMNASLILGDLSRLILPPNNDAFDKSAGIVETKIFTPSFISSIEVFSSRKSTYYEDTKLFSAKATWMSRLMFHIIIKIFGLGNNSIQRLSFLSREIFIIINFAYLVLCIHVISLTISPFLKRIFILKDYSKTLDHLSCLTPDVPYGGYRKGGLVSSIPRDSSSESVVVINMEHPRVQSSATMDPFEIELDLDLSEQPLMIPLEDYQTSISAENFKTFCMKPPSTHTPVSGYKSIQNKTFVDRKRSNSTATPSTTIMDKYFTISTQPIWTWLAAIKILIAQPILFSGLHMKPESEIIANCKKLGLILVSVEDSKIIFQLLDASHIETLKSSLSVRVNGISWMFVDVHVSHDSQNNTDNVYISVYGLSSLRQFQVEFLENGVLVEDHAVSTSSRGKSNPSKAQDFSAVGLLQSSLLYTISSLGEMKATFKKSKKDESKRVADLKRQIEALKAKIDKYGVTQTNEGRIGGKLKGLQNSVGQLENEIRELERQIKELENNSGDFEKEYQGEELKLKLEISELEAYLLEYEENTNSLKMSIKNVDGEKQFVDGKLKKTESKLKFKKEEISRLQAEIKGFKKTLTSKIQKRQKKIHDRIETIIPKIKEASEELSEELEGYSNGGPQVK